MQIPLKSADKYALQIVEQIAPFCHRVEIAGSIRRRRPVVNDIDLVVIPKDMDGLVKRFKQRCTPITRGDCNLSFATSSQVQIDVFCAHLDRKDLLTTIPSNFGSVLLCRTGSTAHNIYMIEQAKRLKLVWSPYVGVTDAHFNILAAATEEDIFAALQIPFVKPEDRER
jgi:DNA polymerase (family 10)